MAGTRTWTFALAVAGACLGGAGGEWEGVARAERAVRTLPGHVRPVLRRSVDLGRVDRARRLEGMSLVFAPAGTRAQRDGFLAALQTPGSPLYHQWLSPEQYSARFGAGRDDVTRARKWLEGQGFQVSGLSRAGTHLRFGGTVGQVEAAFRTEMHRYAVRGEEHFALGLEPSVPAELGERIAGLRGVHDFRPKPAGHPVPDFTLTGQSVLGPDDWAAIYDVVPLYQAVPPLDGTGQKIGVVGGAQLQVSDVAAFRAQFGLPPSQPNMTMVPDTGAPTAGGPGFLDEASLDVEWAGAVARNAGIEYVYVGGNPNASVDDAAFYAFENAIAPVVTFTYGLCEEFYSDVDAADFSWEGDLAAMLGITFVAAAGDGAASGCDQDQATSVDGPAVDMPAAIPGAVAVGGTAFAATAWTLQGYLGQDGNAVSYIPEKAWNETSNLGYLLGGVGGPSALYAKPFWQTGISPNDGARDVPDVSFAASSSVAPYYVVAEGAAAAFGGTSCATPTFAGVLALVNQAIGAAQPGLGNANPMLYGFANSSAGAGAFHDITAGDNIVPCSSGSPSCPTSAPYQFGYQAAPGYDLATGNGSIDAARLVHAWRALAPTGTQLAATVTGSAEGAPLSLTATVTSNEAAPPMTGRVVFYYATLDATGRPGETSELGSVPVVATTGAGPQGASVQLATTAPSGLTGDATVSAFYSGDAHYLASWSSLSMLTATSNLALSPVTATVDEFGRVAFVATGGVPPITWSFWHDNSGATIDADTGAYHAGPNGHSTDLVVATDKYGAQALATVTVGGRSDAGVPSGSGSGGGAAAAAVDASVDDGGGPSEPQSSAPTSEGTPSDAGAAPGEHPSSAAGSGCSVGAGPRAPGGAGAWGLALAAAAVGARRARLRDRGRSWCRTSSSATRRGPRRAPSPW
jgi:hypothetical protein